MDGSHPYVLKECSREMAVPLHYIYKKSLEEEWKQAKVVPIYKKGSKIKASNYRPISLTSMPCKVMESLIRDNALLVTSQTRTYYQQNNMALSQEDPACPTF